MAEAPKSITMLTGQQRIAELAKQAPSMALTNLSQYLTYGTLLLALARTRRDGAVCRGRAVRLREGLAACRKDTPDRGYPRQVVVTRTCAEVR